MKLTQYIKKSDILIVCWTAIIWLLLWTVLIKMNDVYGYTLIVITSFGVSFLAAIWPVILFLEGLFGGILMLLLSKCGNYLLCKIFKIDDIVLRKKHPDLFLNSLLWGGGLGGICSAVIGCLPLIDGSNAFKESLPFTIALFLILFVGQCISFYSFLLERRRKLKFLKH